LAAFISFLATYQGEAFLPGLLQSILVQTYAIGPCWCANDGSSDATRSILGMAAANDPRIGIAEDDFVRRERWAILPGCWSAPAGRR